MRFSTSATCLPFSLKEASALLHSPMSKTNSASPVQV